MDSNLIRVLDEIRAIAQTGLNYSKDDYELERYNKLMDIVTREYTKVYDYNEEYLRKLFDRELGSITPKVGVNGIVLDEDHNVLLELRAIDKKWGVIGGWSEVGESPQESLIREFKEETGLNIIVKDLIHIFTQRPGDYGYPVSSYHILYYCEVVDGVLKKSHESLELGYYDYEIIKNWHRDHREMIKTAMNYLKKHNVIE
ncbi:ADP-ribose pyrophosphatase [Vallitalea longa]|uniref:ADP-ribose pyrophosphatase n=1 Tax=Vallitalea longa TaxID=2936439 RepID=A0A9W6DEY5_9FIRM|nr:NUDIX hydrolase N-terminal domain-containing protein [Vallitalea longa]GKX30676.1 ADP-ribose pyrophosphatase [Vallitalea longa]